MLYDAIKNRILCMYNKWSSLIWCRRISIMPPDVSRLDSIRAAHGVGRRDSSPRMEDYLEVMAELVELKGYATTLDISRYMNVSAPSVTKMLHRLDEGGFLKYEKYHGINLTNKGRKLADSIRQRHGTLLEFFDMLGITGDAANQDAEGIEHHLNPETVFQLRKFITYLKANPKIIEEFGRL